MTVLTVLHFIAYLTTNILYEDYWDAWRLVEDVIRERPVDLIEIESAGEALRQVIERYGVEL